MRDEQNQTQKTAFTGMCERSCPILVELRGGAKQHWCKYIATNLKDNVALVTVLSCDL